MHIIRTYSLYLPPTVRVEEIGPSETGIDLYRLTQPLNQENSDLLDHRCEKFRSNSDINAPKLGIHVRERERVRSIYRGGG
jgi:hypothetical protein